MANDLVFYTNPMSRGRIVRWMLEEIGEPYETRIIEYGPPMKAPAYLAINPMGKVPAISHRGAIVTECGAICTYLADAFPKAGLAPAVGDPTRAPYLRWMFFAAGPLEAAATNKSFGVALTPKQEGMAGYGSLADVMNAIEGAVTKHEYVAGDKFSAADIYLGSSIGWGMMFGTLDKRAAFEAYFKRISARPAAARARAIDDALTPPPKT
jgi:glutathione S-transferase